MTAVGPGGRGAASAPPTVGLRARRSSAGRDPPPRPCDGHERSYRSPAMITVQVRTDRRIARRDLDAARRAMAHLDRYVDRPLLSARLTVRRTHAAQPYAVDATVQLDGRLLAAHTTGRSATRAASEAAEALRRQVLRIAGAAVARRNEPRVVGNGPPPPPHPGRGVRLKPPEKREIVRRRTYVDVPLADLRRDRRARRPRGRLRPVPPRPDRRGGRRPPPRRRAPRAAVPAGQRPGGRGRRRRPDAEPLRPPARACRGARGDGPRQPPLPVLRRRG